MTERRQRKRISDRARIQRSLSIGPSLCTIGNIFCGYYSLIWTLRGNWDDAAVRNGLELLINNSDCCRCIAALSDAEAALVRLPALQPDAVVQIAAR